MQLVLTGSNVVFQIVCFYRLRSMVRMTGMLWLVEFRRHHKN